ncbi:carbon-nitrogen hydrolase family protein [Cohnella sp. WQ 127256]|uniref:carbon-nitrogen hydrolase family protein n=1 Tax=Cohnella sp. WQ 127256 TaxID=2938790 RepID=UPI0021183148|nr:carbon-nitrogen hydrolase family protein [Cohnella sp. WQ 127256]
MNLVDIDHMEEEDWEFWTPRTEVSPSFNRVELDTGKGLQIKGAGHEGSYGSWHSKLIKVEEKRKYELSTEYEIRDVANEQVSIYAVATWFDEKGILLQRDYIDQLHFLHDGWRRLCREIDSPRQAALLRLELSFRWSATGTVTWRNTSIEVCGKPGERNVRVATTYIKPTNDLDTNLELMLEVLDKSGSHHPDIICLTETFYEGSVELPLTDKCQSIPGLLTNEIGKKAVAYNCYVLFTMYEREKEHIYNTAVLIGRDGGIVGKYRKMHLPLYEAESGVMPGSGHGIFDTDFGRIGVLICYDQEFPESSRILALLGAEVIFIPTIGEEMLQTRARARDNGLHVVVSGCDGPVSSRIIDPMGDIVGHVIDEETGVYSADIRLDEQRYTFWLSVGAGKGESRSLFKKERRTDEYSALLLTNL